MKRLNLWEHRRVPRPALVVGSLAVCFAMTCGDVTAEDKETPFIERLMDPDKVPVQEKDEGGRSYAGKLLRNLWEVVTSGDKPAPKEWQRPTPTPKPSASPEPTERPVRFYEPPRKSNEELLDEFNKVFGTPEPTPTPTPSPTPEPQRVAPTEDDMWRGIDLDKVYNPPQRPNSRPRQSPTSRAPSYQPPPAPTYQRRSTPDPGSASVPFPSGPASSAIPSAPDLRDYGGSPEPTARIIFDDNAPRSRFGYDESLPKTPANPKGVLMRLKSDPGAIREESAPKSLLDRLRPTS